MKGNMNMPEIETEYDSSYFLYWLFSSPRYGDWGVKCQQNFLVFALEKTPNPENQVPGKPFRITI